MPGSSAEAGTLIDKLPVPPLQVRRTFKSFSTAVGLVCEFDRSFDSPKRSGALRVVEDAAAVALIGRSAPGPADGARNTEIIRPMAASAGADRSRLQRQA